MKVATTEINMILQPGHTTVGGGGGEA